MQCPNFNALTLVSMAAALMSITYSTIAFGASVAHGPIPDVQYNLNGFTLANGLFGVWNALGTVAFAYGGHNVVLEIQVPVLRLAQPPAAFCLPLSHPGIRATCILSLMLRTQQHRMWTI
jgi:hypothetical protein